MLFSLVLLACSSLDRHPQMVNIRGVVFGTYYSITYYEEEGRVFDHPIDSLFKDFNQSLSFYHPESLLSRINRNEEVNVDHFFKPVFLRSAEIYEETGGAFDPTVFPLVNAWGFGVSAREEMTPERVDSLLALVGFHKLRLSDGQLFKEDDRVQLDFNAIAKGYAADVIGAFLESQGVEAYLIEIGGDIIARGVKPDGNRWRIGLEIPAADALDGQDWEYYVEVEDRGLATSGDYRRYQEVEGVRYSHTINPATGYPVDHSLVSVSVFAPDAMSADAYATALMVMGKEAGIRFVEDREDLEAYFIFGNDEGDLGYYISSGLVLFSREDL